MNNGKEYGNYGIFTQNALMKDYNKSSNQRTAFLGQIVKIEGIDDSGAGEVSVRFLKEGDTWEPYTFVCDDHYIMPVRQKLWGFMQAITSPAERVKLAKNSDLCEQLCNIAKDYTVHFIDDAANVYMGQIKYMGAVKGIGKCIGVQLHEKKNNNKCDGSCAGIQYFNCLPGYGIFTTIDRIVPINYVNRDSNLPNIVSTTETESAINRCFTSFVNNDDLIIANNSDTNDNNKPIQQYEKIVTKYGEYMGKTPTMNHRQQHTTNNGVRNSLSLQNMLDGDNTTNDFDQNSVIQTDKIQLINGLKKKNHNKSQDIDLIEIIGGSWNGGSSEAKQQSDYDRLNKKTTTAPVIVYNNDDNVDDLVVNNKVVNNNSVRMSRNKSINPLSHVFDGTNTLSKNTKFYVNYTDYDDKSDKNNSSTIINRINHSKDEVNNKKLNEKNEAALQQQQKQSKPSTSTTKATTTQIKYHAPQAGTTNGFTVDSLVEVSNDISDEPLFGVIRWLGVDNTTNFVLVGVELENEQSHLPLTLTDGVHNGERFFKCGDNRALFVPLMQCHRDSRFQDGVTTTAGSAAAAAAAVTTSSSYHQQNPDDARIFESFECPVIQGAVAPLCMPTEDDVEAVCAKFRGIQGHHNSCYLDVMLFAMFTYTAVFDSLLFRPKGPNDIDDYHEVQRVLREEIVNPLRKNLFVSADHVMNLRKLLDRLSSVSGLTSEEKDPEEFLNSLLAQILKAEPFLKLNSGQESFYYQLFVEKDADLTLPTVQQLFEQSFLTSNIKLKEVPSCLIVQMPRFGKSYKMYPRILPSQLLDVTDVIEGSPRQCIVCGKLARWECRECFDDCSNAGLESTAFCVDCLKMTHRHERRCHHQPVELQVSRDFLILEDHCRPPRLFMELFAVICIETSHYVAFVKCGVGHEAPWCFFDSMADRKGEKNGYNIPEMVACPDISKWLSDELMCRQLHEEFPVDRHLPEHARRLLCDAYICMYQSPDVMMYR